jgi:hypothetical protein
MAIIFTSFNNARCFAGKKYSIARRQPAGFAYEELRFWSATDKDGFGVPLKSTSRADMEEFKDVLYEGYKTRWKHDIAPWLSRLNNEHELDAILCCWCPYSKRSMLEFRMTGKFGCHSGLIAQIINAFRPEIEIFIDHDRNSYLVDEMLPFCSAALGPPSRLGQEQAPALQVNGQGTHTDYESHEEAYGTESLSFW